MMTGYTFDHDKTDKSTPDTATSAAGKPSDLNPRSIYGMTNSFKIDETPTAAVSAFGISLSPDTRPLLDDDNKSVDSLEVLPVVLRSNGHVVEERDVVVAGRKPDALITITEHTNEIVAQDVDLAKLPIALHHPVAGMDENTGEATKLMHEREKSREEEGENGAESKSNFFASVTSLLNLFARNFYTLQTVGLAMAFAINAILLLYKVRKACHRSCARNM